MTKKFKKEDWKGGGGAIGSTPGSSGFNPVFPREELLDVLQSFEDRISSLEKDEEIRSEALQEYVALRDKPIEVVKKKFTSEEKKHICEVIEKWLNESLPVMVADMLFTSIEELKCLICNNEIGSLGDTE